MSDTRTFILHARLDPERLETWIAAGWLLPQQNPAAGRFSEADLARAQLIRDLTDDLGVNQEGIDVILGLIDQLHGMRRTLRELLLSIQAQPETMRRHSVTDIRAISARTVEKSRRPRGRKPGKARGSVEKA